VTRTWNLSHEKFSRDVLDSHAGTVLVADLFRHAGRVVALVPMYIHPADDPDSSPQYSDSGDLYEIVRGDGLLVEAVKFEVKCRKNIKFTDEPGSVKYDSIFVCEEYTLSRMDEDGSHPKGWFILSNCRGYYIYVGIETRKDWYKVTKHDRRYGGDLKTYWTCPSSSFTVRAFPGDMVRSVGPLK